MIPDDDSAWVPAGILWRGSGPVVEWRRIGAQRFTHPFFRDTIKAAGDCPRRETPLEFSGESVAAAPGLPPAGFIFHLSRCGSTLLTQMLAALPQHVVLSEPAPVDHILWPPVPLAEESQRVRWLRRILALLGRRRHPAEERLFVKFDSWHTLDLPLIRRAFPDVPWIFVYRDPVEILVSHSLSPGSHMIPGLLDPERLGISRPPWTGHGLRTYAAQVLARIAAAALDHFDAAGRLVHYQELPGMLPAVLRHLKVDTTPGELANMLAASAHHSKEPWRTFTVDSDLRQTQATPSLRAIAGEIVGELYGSLEAGRRAQPTGAP